jgi:glutathione S-transferase
MALAQIDLAVELREISLKERPRELYDISPKGTVPVLKFANGDVIDESLDIMFYCVNHKKGRLWLNNNEEIQLQLIKIIDEDFKPWLDKYKYHDRHPEQHREYYREKCNGILQQFEDMLNQEPFLTGKELQLVDAAVFPFIRQFANVDKDWFDTAFDYLPLWLKLIQESPIFTNVMQKYKFWGQGDKPLLIKFSLN